MSTVTPAPLVAYFDPSHWGDQFLHFTPIDKEQEVEHLKEAVLKELQATSNKPLDQLDYIDAIERLGVAYNFEEQIEEALQQVYECYHDQCDKDDLYHVSTRFRILRQHGFYVPCDVFKKFKNDEGVFKSSIVNDVRSIFNLYEASHVRIRGDDILDEAFAFTTTHLKNMADRLSSPLDEQAAHALHQPLHKGFIRLESKHYIEFYEQDASHNKTLLKLAKLDFNLLQLLHKQELRDISNWWKNFYSKVPYTRDRLVEGYFWILGCYYEPKYSFARKIFIKLFMILQVFDDTFDAYGTYDTLKLLVEAVRRWDYSYVAQLPEYFNSCYQILLETVDEAEKELVKEGNVYGIHHLKEQMSSTCESWLIEANWRRENCIPRYDAYMEVARISIAYNVGIIASFLGMGTIATKESYEWVFQNPMPKLVEASFTILRLMNDVGGTKFEQGTREHVASSIQCYMTENKIVDQEDVYLALEKLVEDAWKNCNEAMLQPYMIPKPLLDRIHHLNSAADVFYKGRNDGYTVVNQILKDKIASVLVHPIPL